MKTVLKRFLGQRNVNALRGIQYGVQAFYLGLGRDVKCNICGNSFSRFLRFCGRHNVWCPSCKSLGRHRLLYAFLEQEMAFFDVRLKVLHFAPEACLSQTFRQHHDYISADLMVSALPHVSAKPDRIMSVTAINFADSSFDVVLCNHVLEHVRDDDVAIKEIFRVLRQGGWAILQVPINYQSEVTHEDPSLTPRERARQYGFEDHLRFYGLDYKERLAAAGFVVEERDFVKTLDVSRYRLDEKEIIYLCTKP